MKPVFFIFCIFPFVQSCSQPNKNNTVVVAQESVKATNTNTGLDTNWTSTIVKSNEEWKKILTPEQYYITREQGTEKPFSSEWYENKLKGVYTCICCQNPLFTSDTKFNSGTGWPSYYAPFSSKSVAIHVDKSHGMVREEVACKRCNAHLGHVFDDGPKPTGLRYCIDGIALNFVPTSEQKLAKATLAAGCFWCMEGIFENLKGVRSVVSGYAGGNEKNPTYELVGSGKTGHAEAIEIEYDANQISFKNLLKVFFAGQDPTQVDGQGPDHGRQYRSIIFYRNDTEKKIAQDYIKELDASKFYSKPIATELEPYTTFWQAEDYHQNYIINNPNNPYVKHESIPRLNRTKDKVQELFKKEN